MRKILIVLTLAIAAAGWQAGAQEARLLRFPATNGSEIVFSYAGDLYKVSINGGEAKRLTSHVGYEIFPRFSPDGRTIAFTGQYDGNTEVYSIPSGGGEPLRLTYTGTNSRDDLGDRMGPNNMVLTWTVDGDKVVYRNRRGSSFAGQLYLIGNGGGLSEQIPLPEGGFCSFSPDGKKLAYNRVMREFRTWKYYRGGMADDIWIYDPQAQAVTNVTDNPAQDIIPMWIGDEIFFISDRDRTMNIFVYDTKSGKTEKVTNFTEYDVKFPSAHGATIVFENGGYIYKMDARTRRPEKVSITLSSDNIYARSEVKEGSRYVTALGLAPDGSRLAVTARGEVFDVPVEKGVTRNITRSPGSHERGTDWSPDGKYIAWISDSTGETEIWMREAAGGEPVQMTSDNDTYIRSLQWSPDSRTILYTDRMNRINLLDVKSKKRTVAVRDAYAEFRGVEFSPDSKWLTYTRQAENEYDVVYLYNIADGKQYPVTDKWYDSSSPVFSTDGKYLVFVSARDFYPLYGALEWNHIYNNMNGLYIAMLAADTPSPFMLDDAQVKVTAQPGDKKSDKKEDKKSDKKGDTAKEETVTVKIDTEGISDRIVRVSQERGYFRNLYSDGKKVWYSQGQKTKVFDLKKQKTDDVADAAMFVSGKKAIFMKGRDIYVTDIPQGKANLTDKVDLSNMRITTDYPQEWTQIYNEAWRIMRDGFYLENMHGVDWVAIKAKYAAMLPYVKTRLDLNYLIGEMIGELNVGHAYINPGEYEKAERIQLGLLGAQVSRDPATGFFRIEKILEGANWSSALRSPLREPGIKANVGDYIVAIDGVPTNTVKDMYALLTGKAGVPTELQINPKPQAKGATKAVVSPISSESELYDYEWVQGNIKKVEEASGGRIGYIYIPDMGVEGLNEFAKHFYPQLDKEGLIIDDRANGGGNVSPMILERLAREPYRLTMRRGSERIGTVPDAVQVGPKVCLTNKYSASDGDLFPYGFRALGLGKLIGTRTWGGIVGISGSLPFVDGTDMRVPFFTSYSIDGEWIIENYGVNPDIVVDNDPIKEFNGEDQQLDRAIEEVMKQLPNRRPLAPVPAPRVWNK